MVSHSSTVPNSMCFTPAFTRSRFIIITILAELLGRAREKRQPQRAPMVPCSTDNSNERLQVDGCARANTPPLVDTKSQTPPGAVYAPTRQGTLLQAKLCRISLLSVTHSATRLNSATRPAECICVVHTRRHGVLSPTHLSRVVVRHARFSCGRPSVMSVYV
ncbi:hypothetical protein LSAT2_024714 [Lamellibrachia satsuma]|nr:hypothetical protein LSAT2_024714 [Lamellibrachia satsuma]